MDYDTRKAWAEAVLSTEEWAIETIAARPQKGESAGCWVRSAQSKALGYLKPRKKSSGRFRAAYEKLASDFAFHLGVNVPPAVLWVRSTAPPAEEKCTAVSLVPQGELYEWSHFASVTNPALKALLRNALKDGSDAPAFDAWMGNQDRGNLDNTLFAFDEERPLFFLDFSNSMDFSGQWTAGDHLKFRRLGLPAMFKESLSRDATRGFAQKILAFPDDKIRGLVSRIPHEFLPADVGEKTTKWLIERKNQLYARFDEWYP